MHNPLITDPPYRILSIDYTHSNTVSFFLAYNNIFICGTQLSYPSFRNYDPNFSLASNYTRGTHYNCSAPIPLNSIQGLQNASCIGCKGQDPSNICYYAPNFDSTPPPYCQIVIMFPAVGTSDFNASAVKDMRGLLQKGFELKYSKLKDCLGCEASGGRCGANPTRNGSFNCFCPSSVHSKNCTDGLIVDVSTWVNEAKGRRSGIFKGIVAGICASLLTLLLAVIVSLVVILVRKNKNIRFIKETFSKISPTRYSYSQIRKFTNNFSSKLGEGGFGSVYKGTIRKDGAEVAVAVKVIKRTRQIEEQFMNEVALIGTVHHHNLVSILGFCVDRGTHALVYEFMQNGSLDHCIYTSKKQNENTSDNKRLSTSQVFSIALETGRGILYLHQGCRVKILHCDIKPSNVLLDSNFSAKVADFGLARMMDKDCSHISLTGAQGTPGYAAPEMWLKNFGPVTEKSDVYSYGMLLLEIVGRRKIYDSQVTRSTEAYFPEWIYNRMAKGKFSPFFKEGSSSGGDSSESFGDEENNLEDEEEKVVTRMCLVGLWCIQNIPSNRPSMDRVVQMLEGHGEIGIPPNPFSQNTTVSRESSLSYSKNTADYLPLNES
ncbi:non-specific serine/threonine protein kinase [Ranunculus cassubicifolius]